MTGATIQRQPRLAKSAELVRTLIHEWDPYALIAGGAPDDEWDHEIAKIVEHLAYIHRPEDAVLILSKIFSDAFIPEDFPPEACQEIGERLYYLLKEENLL